MAFHSEVDGTGDAFCYRTGLEGPHGLSIFKKAQSYIRSTPTAQQVFNVLH